MPVATLDQIRAQVGQEIGVSPWIAIDQAAIDQFAEVTGDRQFIHVDPVAAAQTPFGGTVAHGFLTLSLLSQMASHVMLVPETTRMAANYGLDSVRFLAPVRAGKRIRGRFVLKAAEEKRPGEWRFVHAVTVEIEGESKPALLADWVGLIFT
ncbi:MaoC family dehydratase [Allosphingosinicella sp.]|uniref:MaoC family dehydratase n=1 Tax=Allosphingosinicella sp. TaxID=2823234 RepID=UPI003D7438E1